MRGAAVVIAVSMSLGLAACSGTSNGNADQAAAQPRVGNLPLPVQYPLLRGDAELWPNLTLAQQQRALQFLGDGSTIRSSLEVD